MDYLAAKQNLATTLSETVSILQQIDLKQLDAKTNWSAVVADLLAIEDDAYEDALRVAQNLFRQDEEVIIGYLEEIKSMAYEQKQMPDWEFWLLLVTAYLATRSVEQWKEAYTPILLSVMVASSLYMATLIDITSDPEVLTTYMYSSTWFQNYVLKFADTVSNTTENAIRQILDRAIDESYSVDKVRRQLQETFQVWIDGMDAADPDFRFLLDRVPSYRSQIIARTELNRAMNAANYQQMTQWGARYKTWFTALDERVRDSHIQAHGQIRSMQELFVTGMGSKMTFPMDQSHGAPAEDIIQCRCVAIYTFDKEEAERVAEKYDE